MAEKIRPIIGVVAAEVNNIEQRQILEGIVEQAQASGIDVAVISNIYNSNSPDDANFFENEIYDLIMSDDLDGLIFISESFVNDLLKEKIRQLFLKRRNLPIIAVGTTLSELAELNLRYINTDGQRDIEDLTDHLIDVHGFRNIDMITGYKNIEASDIRVRGYRRSLEKHGIAYDESKVYYGNFWMNSGEELAEKYINGTLAMPEAIVCANDYMAYGILDKLMEHGIPVPHALTVVGYEYVWERIYHSPLLTTYQRNRSELGKSAVRLLFGHLSGDTDIILSPPRGTLICGESCPCRTSSKHYVTELKSAKTGNMYAEWNIISPMDRQLTSCSNVDEFAEVMGKNSFLVRYVQDVLLCLFEKWYDGDAAEQDIISCRSVLPWHDTSVMLMNKYNFSRIFAKNLKPAVYYFTPLFFGEKSFGYTVLRYDTPDTYDIIYKNWIKSLCNALEFIRMKNDIRYFTAYDNLSEQYDSVTGIYNSKGFDNAVKYTVKNSNSRKAIFMMIKLLPPDNSLDILNKQLLVSKEISDCLKNLSSELTDFCGCVERNLYCYAAFGDFPDELPALLSDKLRLLMIYRTSCVKEWGLHSFITAEFHCDIEALDYTVVFSELKGQINRQEKEYMEMRLIPMFTKFLKCRSKILLKPYEDHTITKLCMEFSFSEGHFRKLYKDCFGTSFHQDCLNCKVDYAKYLLCTTSLDTSSVSGKCGYIDTKYFMRTFQKNTSYTVKQYREIFQ